MVTAINSVSIDSKLFWNWVHAAARGEHPKEINMLPKNITIKWKII